MSLCEHRWFTATLIQIDSQYETMSSYLAKYKCGLAAYIPAVCHPGCLVGRYCDRWNHPPPIASFLECSQFRSRTVTSTSVPPAPRVNYRKDSVTGCESRAMTLA